MRGVVWLLCILLVTGCTSKPRDIGVDALYRQEIEQWHVKRTEELRSTSGWLNVVGLYWLKDGINTFGIAETNDIVFPAPMEAARAGYFVLQGGKVTQQLFPDVSVTMNGSTVKNILLFHPDSTVNPVMESGSLQWFIIRRGSRYGVRLRDLKSQELESFRGIERFQVDQKWRARAVWQPAEGRTIPITNILGQTTLLPSPGTLLFRIDGTEYKLDAIDEGGDELFILFGDATNANETYGAGRYLYLPKPGTSNVVMVDFNKAENPPCAFTQFATCPLPPIQNVMEIAITAGEKIYEHH